jgi:hypothetical protein
LVRKTRRIKKTLGRSRRTWEDNIKTDLGEDGMIRDWIHLSHIEISDGLLCTR